MPTENDVQIVTLDELRGTALMKVMDIDVMNWYNVLSAEYETADKVKILDKQCNRFFDRCINFPEGELVACIVPDGDVADWNVEPFGVISALRINASDAKDVPAKWHETTGNGYFTTHKHDGNMLVCASISVHPNSKGIGISDKLILAELDLAAQLELDHMIAYSRPSNYARFVKEFGPTDIEKYLKARNGKGRLYDRAIDLHDRNGAKVARILPDGRPLDPDSLGYNVIMDYSHLL